MDAAPNSIPKQETLANTTDRPKQESNDVQSRVANSKVARCAELLRDDYGRQSSYLHIDDVNRMVSRLRLSADDAISVWETLASFGIEIDGLQDTVEPVVTPTKPEREAPIDVWRQSYGNHELLTHEQEIQLGRRIRAGRAAGLTEFSTFSSVEHQRIIQMGEHAKARLILSNIRLVIHCSKKFSRVTLIPIEDLVQEGILGLYRAVEKYDPERGFKFSTYATWWINQFISRCIELTGRTVRVPVHMFDRLRKLKRKRRRLANELNRKPTSKELSRELGIGTNEVALLLQIEKDTRSLDTANFKDNKNIERRKLKSKAPNPTVAVEQEELTRIINDALEILDERSRTIVVLRFGLNGTRPKTLKQLGKKFGVTRERIRQIQKRALEKIGFGEQQMRLRDYFEFEEQAEEKTQDV